MKASSLVRLYSGDFSIHHRGEAGVLNPRARCHIYFLLYFILLDSLFVAVTHYSFPLTCESRFDEHPLMFSVPSVSSKEPRPFPLRCLRHRSHHPTLSGIRCFISFDSYVRFLSGSLAKAFLKFGITGSISLSNPMKRDAFHLI